MAEFVPADESSVAALNEAINAPQAKEIKTLAPSSNEVSLPGGYINREGVLVKHAEVRELNGAGEEALSKVSNPAKLGNRILQRGVTTIGGEKATPEDLDRMLSGDRDALLLGIRKVTFGNTLEQFALCGSCGESSVVEVDLNEDIPVKSLDNPIEDRVWTMDLKVGAVTVTLPKGAVQRKIAENSDKTNSELNTILLSDCVISINGEASMGVPTVLRLSMGDREKIITEIVERNPGPRVGEVKSVCESCGGQVSIPMSLTGLFRI